MAGGYHLFSSGEVLTAANANNYLMNQTVMVFASAAARTTALSGVLAEGMTSYRTDSHVFEVYNGTAWVASETNLTTKGDLATYDTAPNRLAVGTDGQILMANSGSTPGLAWVGYSPAGKNAIINGGMDIWQRGTSIAASGTPLYTADRWGFYRSSSGVGGTVTRQTSGLTGVKYTARVQRDSGNTAVTLINFYQTVETLNALQYAGKTLTLSFYARSGANFSQAASKITAQVQYGTGTDENFIYGFTGATDVANSAITISSAWTLYQITTSALSTSATEIGLNFSYTPVGTAGANDYFEITGVQLELGSTATAFSRAGGSIGGELSLAQRYFAKSYNTDVAPASTGQANGLVMIQSGVVAISAYFGGVPFPVTMRTPPTMTIYSFTSGTATKVSDASGTDLAAASGGTNLIGTRSFAIQNNSGGILTPAAGGFLFHYAASAEL